VSQDSTPIPNRPRTNAFGDTRIQQTEQHRQQIAPNKTIRKTGKLKAGGGICPASCSLPAKIEPAPPARTLVIWSLLAQATGLQCAGSCPLDRTSNTRSTPAKDFRKAWIHATLRRKLHGGHLQRSSPNCAAPDSLPTGFRVCTPERGRAVTPFTRRCDFGHKMFFKKKLEPGFGSPPRKRSESTRQMTLGPVQERAFALISQFSGLPTGIESRSPAEQEGSDWRVEFTIWDAGSGCDPWHWRKQRRGRQCICEACELSLRRPGENT
jgi:hypothetical protein